MSDYRRWISYIYSYEHGEKRNNAGYARIELRDNKVKMTVYMTPGKRDGNVKVCYYKSQPEHFAGVCLGKLDLSVPAPVFRIEIPASDMMGSGLFFMEMNGLLLFGEDGNYYASSWDEGILEEGIAREVMRLVNQSLQKEQRSVDQNSQKEQTSVDQNSQKEQGSVNQNLQKEQRLANQNSQKEQTLVNQNLQKEQRSVDQNSQKEQTLVNQDSQKEQKKTELELSQDIKVSSKIGKDQEQASETNKENKADNSGAGQTSGQTEGKPELVKAAEIKKAFGMIMQKRERKTNKSQTDNINEIGEMDKTAIDIDMPESVMPRSMFAAASGIRGNNVNETNETKTVSGVKEDSINSVNEANITAFNAPENMTRLGFAAASGIRGNNINEINEIESGSSMENRVNSTSETESRINSINRAGETENRMNSINRAGETENRMNSINRAGEAENRVNNINRADETENRMNKTAGREENCETKNEAADNSLQSETQSGIKERAAENETLKKQSQSKKAQETEHRNCCRGSSQEERIFCCLPPMFPFEEAKYEKGVRMEPQDIGMLPRDLWKLAGNSFLLHAYYTYHHLLFVRKRQKDGMIYYLMVPGIYNEKEQHLAQMFGFCNFCPVKRKALEQGDFGYWYLEVKF